MAERIIVGPLYKAGGNTPWINTTLKFTPANLFASSSIGYGITTYTAVTDEDGDFSVTLAVPDSGSITYRVTFTDGSYVDYALGSGATLSIADIINAGTTDGTPNELEQLLADLLFTDLADTPNSYSGQAGKYVKVNSGETALEFSTVSGGGTSDHGELSGLADDDHTQYLNTARGDARYYTESEIDTLLGNKSDTGHTHDTRYYTETETDTLLLDYLLQADFTWDNLSGKPSTFAPSTHNHDDRYFTEPEINTTLLDYLLTANLTWNNLGGKPSTFPPDTHIHDDRYYTETETNTLLTDKSDSDHTHTNPVVIPVRAQYQNTTWNTMPAALTNFLGGSTPGIKFDLSDCTQARLVVRQASAGAASAELRMQYSHDESTWAYLDGATGPAVEANTANTSKVSSWVTITADARADVWLRLAGINGDGALSPSFQNISLHAR